MVARYELYEKYIGTGESIADTRLAADGEYVLFSDHEQALAEKDLQWKRRVGLDCGGHSCFYAIDKAGMRHNGPCSCNPKRTREDHDRLYAAYQQLMTQAVRFAKQCEKPVRGKPAIKIAEEAEAFLKEREGA